MKGDAMADQNRIKEMVKTAWLALDEKQASDISVIDISQVSVVADYFIVASAENVRQTEALCDNVEEKLGRAGFALRQVEGRNSGTWILMDYNDVIIHIFDKENRLFYDIERIWRDGKHIVDINQL